MLELLLCALVQKVFSNSSSHEYQAEHIKEVLSLSNRLSSTIGGNREMDQSYTTSQVSNVTRLNLKKRKTENKEHINKITLILLYNKHFIVKLSLY